MGTIYGEAIRTGKPVFCIVDDTISSKTKPSSRALHPIGDAYFHQSHLKGRQDYGHQAVAIMLSCNGLILNHPITMYDKSVSKIWIVKEAARGLPVPPVVSYFLCDSWYTPKDIMMDFLRKGFYTAGALKSNRTIYPRGIRCSIREFSRFMEVADRDVSLVTVGSCRYHVYRYEGELNGIDDAAVLVTFPVGVSHNPRALRDFICTDTSLDNQEILDIYTARWTIEVYFRRIKNVLAFDKYQIRSSKGICRFWLLMSLVHFICCTVEDKCGALAGFEDGYAYLCKKIREEQIGYLYDCSARNVPLQDVLPLVR